MHDALREPPRIVARAIHDGVWEKPARLIGGQAVAGPCVVRATCWRGQGRRAATAAGVHALAKVGQGQRPNLTVLVTLQAVLEDETVCRFGTKPRFTGTSVA